MKKIKRKHKKAPRKAAPLPAIAALLLDRSGSMADCAVETIGATNAWLESLKGMQICLAQFDNVDPFEKLLWMKDPGDYRLDKTIYVPRGSTPLYDATLQMLRELEKVAKPGQKVAVTIQTDGQENASGATLHSVKEAIKAAEARGWAITFMGTGIDGWAGKQMGLAAQNIISSKSKLDIRATMVANAVATASYAAGTTSARAFYADTKSDGKIDIG